MLVSRRCCNVHFCLFVCFVFFYVFGGTDAWWAFLVWNGVLGAGFSYIRNILGTSMSHPKGIFEDDVPFPKVGDVSFQWLETVGAINMKPISWLWVATPPRLNTCFLATIMLISNNHTQKSAKKALMLIHFDVTRANSYDSVMTTNSLMAEWRFTPLLSLWTGFVEVDLILYGNIWQPYDFLK